MENQKNMIAIINNIITPPKAEYKKEEQPKANTDIHKNLYNKDTPKYRKKKLNQIFNMKK